ncbi:hypothetical protein HPT27_14570 [Permianibacter sp. IMCC34836]|uniref:hypothetical protein n=1 Tax=Permianibacter fluminis TaxID=2738515 RepID=UPI0015579C0A|nr:hypothetical protein [Permianibacter fluminis]NQD38249.1 hypothetical protein [Permianibacter fluminis]
MARRRDLFELSFEHKRQAPLSAARFRHRLYGYLGFALLVIAVALSIGMLGYHFIEGMRWIDAFLNAAMILGGMGPVSELKTDLGKLFAGCYALFAGLVFLAAAGLIFGPLVHRLLHRFHFAEDDSAAGE